MTITLTLTADEYAVLMDALGEAEGLAKGAASHWRGRSREPQYRAEVAAIKALQLTIRQQAQAQGGPA